ncbi:MAG: saccharopine dehydrogenase C-terminal domain-containing protein [Myxococcota bacterium]
MTRALILGGGANGSAMAMDLARQDGWTVTVADRDEAVLSRVEKAFGVAVAHADLSDASALSAFAAESDVVLAALPSHLGLATLRTVLEAGKNCVDVSFMPQDATSLSRLAREKGAVAVVDCGLAPGLSNMAAGYAKRIMHVCEMLEIYVGGLPAERRWPFQYKAPTSPSDVIEEYTRPANVVQGGKRIVRQAMSDPELIDFPGVGTLEAVLTDGLRTLLHSLKVPFMSERTLRYPGHIELMRVLRQTGMFSKKPIEVKGQTVVPLDVTHALLGKQWAYADGEEDLAVMRVVARGVERGDPVRYQWDLQNTYDRETSTRAMARCVGFTAAIMARMIVDGRFDRAGVHAPETVGQQEGLLPSMLEALAERGVVVAQTRTEL